MANLYYNGVLFPEIPVVDGYLYNYIAYLVENGTETYVLVQTSKPVYLLDTNFLMIEESTWLLHAFYGGEWLSLGETTDTLNVPLGEFDNYSCTLVWTDTDVHNDSVDSTSIYMYNSVPNDGVWYSYNGKAVFPEIPTKYLEELPYVTMINMYIDMPAYGYSMNMMGIIFTDIPACIVREDDVEFFYLPAQTLGASYTYYEDKKSFVLEGLPSPSTSELKEQLGYVSEDGMEYSFDVLWTNYDLPYDSVDGTDIYLEASEPIVTDPPAVIVPKKHYYTGEIFPEIPSNALKNYKYFSIIYSATDYSDLYNQYGIPDTEEINLICSNVKGYLNTVDSKLYLAESSKYEIYKYKDDNWVYKVAYTNTGGLFIGTQEVSVHQTDTGKLIWTNHNICKNSVDSNEVYLKGSDTFPTDGAFKISAKTAIKIMNAARKAKCTNEPLDIIEAMHIFENSDLTNESDGEIQDLEAIMNKTITSISSNIPFIGDYAFAYCSKLTSAHFPKCESIGEGAFSACYSLYDISFSESFSKIGDYAFAFCSKLTSIDLPNCTEVGSGAFWFCTELSNINFLSNLTVAKTYAFGNTKLTSIDMPLCSIVHPGAFGTCSLLQKVSLPNCKSVGMQAFAGCKSLTSINLPSCECIEGRAFANCVNLKTVDLPVCKSVGVNDYSNSLNTAPFLSCSALESINIPNCVYVGEDAFSGCYKLSSINLPNCSYINGYAFWYCSALKTVDIGANIGSSRCYIGTYAFRNCNTLTSLILRGASVCSTGGSLFYSASTPMIYVPSSLITSYKTASFWSSYATRFSAIEDMV